MDIGVLLFWSVIVFGIVIVIIIVGVTNEFNKDLQSGTQEKAKKENQEKINNKQQSDKVAALRNKLKSMEERKVFDMPPIGTVSFSNVLMDGLNFQELNKRYEEGQKNYKFSLKAIQENNKALREAGYAAHKVTDFFDEDPKSGSGMTTTFDVYVEKKADKENKIKLFYEAKVAIKKIGPGNYIGKGSIIDDSLNDMKVETSGSTPGQVQQKLLESLDKQFVAKYGKQKDAINETANGTQEFLAKVKEAYDQFLNSIPSEKDGTDIKKEEHKTPLKADYVPPTLPYNPNNHRHSADQEWERGSIVDVGFQKNCMVCEVLDNPLHYYLKTAAGNPITFFPHKGIRSGWTDYY